MSELGDQATEEMAKDLLGSAVLAEAVYRRAYGTMEFEDTTYYCGVHLSFEANGRHGHGEYYRLLASTSPEDSSSEQEASRRYDDRDEAEAAFEEQVEKWDLEEISNNQSEEDDGDDPVSVLGYLRSVVSRKSRTGETEETDD